MAQLVDQYGRDVDVRRLAEEESAPTLASTRSILANHPSIGLTPQRLAAILLEAERADPVRYLELAEDMEEKDLHYAGVLSRRKLGVSQLEIIVQPASDAPADVEAADLVRSAIARPDLADELLDVMDAIGKGYSATEIIWDTSVRPWVPVCLKWRDPRWFIPDREDGTTLLLRDAGEYKPLTPYKYVVHRPKVKSGLPIRAGLARAAAWSYLFKNYALKDWVSFAEVFGQPYRVGKYAPTATPEDKAALLRAVANIGSDAAAIIPNGMLIEFIEAQRSGSIDLYEKLCRFLDEQISKCVLGQTTTTEVTQGGGSRALGDVHLATYREIQRADARQLGATLTRDIARPIVALNLGDGPKPPQIIVGLPDELTTLQKIDGLKVLVPMGARVAASAARDLLGFPEPAKDAELLTAPASGAVPSLTDPILTGANARRRSGQAARLRQLAAAIAAHASDVALQPDVIDQLTRDALDDSGWEPNVAPLVDPIRAYLDGASSLQDARDRLVELVGKMDLQQIATLLGNADFTAHLAGAAGMQLDGNPSPDDEQP